MCFSLTGHFVFLIIFIHILVSQFQASRTIIISFMFAPVTRNLLLYYQRTPPHKKKVTQGVSGITVKPSQKQRLHKSIMSLKRHIILHIKSVISKIDGSTETPLYKKTFMWFPWCQMLLRGCTVCRLKRSVPQRSLVSNMICPRTWFHLSYVFP